MTVLFADIAGSTGLGERLDPERLREVLDSFFAAMRREIEAEGGTVEKFIGDAVLAVFGVPTAHEDDPTRALRAGLRMRNRLEHLNRSLEELYGIRLAIRIGINTGDVMAHTASAPAEGFVTGDAVNIAARLEQGAEPGQILVGERTTLAVRGMTFEEARSVVAQGQGGAPCRRSRCSTRTSPSPASSAGTKVVRTGPRWSGGAASCRCWTACSNAA